MTKSDQARELLERGDTRSALMLAKTWRRGMTPDERALLIRGAECLHSPEFYAALGYDPESCVQDALTVLRRVLDVR